jgi:hypothetical protein
MGRHLLIIFVGLLGACGFLKPKEIPEEQPIARAYDAFLYPSDLEGLIPTNFSSTDSAKLADRLVQDWLRKQLMIERASKEISLNEAEIERKLLDYRYALTRSAYEQKYIEEHLDTNVSDEEIQAYYAEKSDDFILRQTIVRCLFAKVPENAPRLARFRSDMQAYPGKTKRDVADFAAQYAVAAHMVDSVWVDFEEVIKDSPFEEVVDRVGTLKRRGMVEITRENYIWFLRILDHKMTNEISPLEFVREDIMNIIINKRKLALKRALENEVYEEAARDKAFEIFDR